MSEILQASVAAIETQLQGMPANAGQRSLAILDWARKYLDGVIDTAGVEAVIVAAHELYDRFVAPADIPWVPDRLEPIVDRQAKALITQLIRDFHDRVHEE